MIVAGIDPGLDGAVAILVDAQKESLFLHSTPVLKAESGGKRKFDVHAMRSRLAEWKVDLVVIEAVGAMPGQGVTSMFSFGMGYGIWIGLLGGLEIPFQPVQPAAWKKAILGGTKKDKQAAIQFIQGRFPGVSLLSTPRSKVPHDGYADAACMALHARQLLNGKVD